MRSLLKSLELRHEVLDDGCWSWTGSVNEDGYGRVIRRAGAGGKRWLFVHRLAYELFIGPIPDGLTVDHLCFRRACINPDHLRLLPHGENARNQRSATKTHCKQGHEFTAENTYIRAGGSRRSCRACMADATRRYRARKVI